MQSPIYNFGFSNKVNPNVPKCFFSGGKVMFLCVDEVLKLAPGCQPVGRCRRCLLFVQFS